MCCAEKKNSRLPARRRSSVCAVTEGGMLLVAEAPASTVASMAKITLVHTAYKGHKVTTRNLGFSIDKSGMHEVSCKEWRHGYITDLSGLQLLAACHH